jgi:hypothetical protein
MKYLIFTLIFITSFQSAAIQVKKGSPELVLESDKQLYADAVHIGGAVRFIIDDHASGTIHAAQQLTFQDATLHIDFRIPPSVGHSIEEEMAVQPRGCCFTLFGSASAIFVAAASTQARESRRIRETRTWHLFRADGCSMSGSFKTELHNAPDNFEITIFQNSHGIMMRAVPRY